MKAGALNMVKKFLCFIAILLLALSFRVLTQDIEGFSSIEKQFKSSLLKTIDHLPKNLDLKVPKFFSDEEDDDQDIYRIRQSADERAGADMHVSDKTPIGASEAGGMGGNTSINAGYIHSGGRVQADGSYKENVSGVYLDAVGKQKVDDKLTAIGALGVARSGEAGDSGVADILKDGQSKNAVRLGVGAEYKVLDNLDLRGMARYTDTEDPSQAMEYTFGLQYKF